MTFFRNNAVATINALFDEIRTQLLGQGWTEIVMQAATALPAQNYMGRESIFVAPGLAAGSGNAAGHVIGMAVMNNYVSSPGLQFYAATGIKQMTITSVAVVGTSAVFTANGHPFVVGDLVLFNGTSNALINQPCGGASTAAPALVTAATANTWTQALPTSNGSINGTGGKAVAVYNFTGTRDPINDNSTIGHVPLANGAHRVYGYVDKFRLVVVVEQSAVFRFQMVGPSGREHIQAKASDIAKLVSQVISDGVAASTLTLDRACANLYVGQTISVIPTDRANPGGTVAQAGIGNSTVVTKPSSTQLTAVLPAGTYPAGSIVGKDPSPLCVFGPASTTAINLNAKQVYFSHALAGTRTSPVAHIYSVATQTDTGGVLNVDPDAAGFWQEQRIVLYAAEGRRGPIPGVAAFPIGVASNLDIMRTEDAASAPSGDFLCIPSHLIDACMMCIGPGAT